MSGRVEPGGRQDGVPRVADLGDGVLLLDTRHAGRAGTVGAYVVRADAPGDGFALVETGPGSTLPELLAGLELAGLDPRDLRRILVTHIHLDHAGAAGALSRMTGAEVAVHERGARHLVDPSRLVASAARIYGDRMDELWGAMEPVPAERVRPLADGDELRLGPRVLRAVDSPGHATHHHAFLLDGAHLFTGDAAGVRLEGFDLIRPAVPPPETDLAAWEATCARLAALRPERLLLTHYGRVDDPTEHLEALPRRHRAWAEEVRRGLAAGEARAELVARMRRLEDEELSAAGIDGAHAERYRTTSDAAMTVSGLERWWRTKAPEEERTGLEPA